MFGGHWGIFTAIVLTVITSISFAQEWPNPTLESQPISQTGQEHGAAESESKTTHTGPISIEIGPSLQRLDSAISLLIPEEDKQERERNEYRQIRDLNAQEEMALWAKLMFWATAGTVVLTSVGLFLIWRTLIHTRTAAEASKEMVGEAEATTKAAQQTIAETRLIGEKQLRAYLVSPKIKTANFRVGERPRFKVAIKNNGQTPAKVVSSRMNVKSIRPNEIETDKMFAGRGGSVAYVAPDTEFHHVQSLDKALTPTQWQAIVNGNQIFVVRGFLIYIDAFGKTRRLVYQAFGDYTHIENGEMSFDFAAKRNRAS